MTVEHIPRPLIVELRLMARELGTRMDETPFVTGTVFDIFDLVDEHAALLGLHVSAFGEEVNQGLGRLTDEPDAYFHRVARRLNTELDAILDGYDEVRRLKPDDADFEGWSLLVQIYEETLFQLQLWLEEVVEFLDDPVAGVKRRGVPAGGTVHLQLEMRPPHQMKALTRWLKHRGHDLRAAAHDRAMAEARQQGHLTGMAVGSVLGWWLGG